MKRSAAFFSIALALGAITLVPRAGARTQDAREEGGPIEIEKCQTISNPGSYKLVNNLTFTGATGTCLQIIADSVTIDLAGFTISGPVPLGAVSGPTAIAAGDNSSGIAVRNGSISGLGVGVDLGGGGSIVEGLRVFRATVVGISATGVVKGNTVVGIADGPGSGVGIVATGIVTSNYVNFDRAGGIEIGEGSTVIGNTALGRPDFRSFGISVSCPSNVTNNTALNNPAGNLILFGTGCNDTNNVAP
jgi:hypothetical protein